MRAIFIVLLVGNITFLGYHFFYVAEGEAEPYAEEELTSGVVGEGLRLLDEATGVDGARSAASSNSSASKNPASSAELCTVIGPYGELLQAEYAVERLVALGAPAKIFSLDIQQGEIYWVYLEPEFSEKEALRRLYELQKKNIESYVITRGPLANGISFGRFADYSEAETRSKEVEAQGYKASVKTIPRVVPETWVMIESGYAEKINPTVWVELLKQEPNLEKRQNFCLGVASE